MATQSPCIVRPEGKDGILLATRFAELCDAVAEAEHFGDEQREQAYTLEQALCVVLVVEETVPVYLGKDARLEEYLVTVCTDDAEAMRYPAQAEPAIADTIEDAGESLFIVGEVDGSADVVVAFSAPVVQFVAKDPGIGLADEHVLILLESQVEFLGEAEVAVMFCRVKEAFVKELRAHHTLLAAGYLFIFIQPTALVRDEYDVMPAQNAERLANGCTFRTRRYIFIYGYDDNAAHLSLMIRMSPAESL